MTNPLSFRKTRELFSELSKKRGYLIVADGSKSEEDYWAAAAPRQRSGSPDSSLNHDNNNNAANSNLWSNSSRYVSHSLSLSLPHFILQKYYINLKFYN